MDPLAAVIDLLRPSTALSKPISGRGRWGVRYRAFGKPGFAIVLEGGCWLAPEGSGAFRLGAGDVVLFPATPAFTMASHPDEPCLPTEPSVEAVRHGEADGPPDFRMLGGSFGIDPVHAPVLLGLLPGMVHIRAAEAAAGRLARLIALIRDECAEERPGGEAILARLLEILLVEALRREMIDAPPGLIAGLRDPALARALRAMHADVAAGWTVGELARLAGLSRSAFALRFSATLGCAPMEYLARWRMAVAKDALRRGGVPLDRLAAAIGFESASAFSTAFRRRVGCAPGGFARQSARGGAAVAIAAATP